MSAAPRIRSSLAGSARSIEANRQPRSMFLPARNAVATCRISSALSGSSGCPTMLVTLEHGDHVAVPRERRLRCAPLGGEVHVHQAETLVVALGPLEIVQQGPDQVAAHVDACPDRIRYRPDVAVEVGDAGLIVDGAIGVRLVRD